VTKVTKLSCHKHGGGDLSRKKMRPGLTWNMCNQRCGGISKKRERGSSEKKRGPNWGQQWAKDPQTNLAPRRQVKTQKMLVNGRHRKIVPA